MKGRQISAAKGARILIVEDEAIVAMDLQTRLTSLGYSVLDVVSSGEEAVDVVVQERPDLALMDIRLRGEVDGVEAADEIRARYDVPVIYLTALADEETLERARVTVPSGYLVKPFEERELRATIEMALHKHELEAALRRSREQLWLLSERLTVLHEIDRAILAAESSQAIAYATLRRIRRLVAPCCRASVVVFDFERDRVEILAVHVNGETHLEEGVVLPLSSFEGIPVLRQGRHCIVDDVTTLTEPSSADERLLGEGIRSYVSLPLIAQDDLIGALNLEAEEPGVFGEETVDVCREVASSLAVAIRQARLGEEVEQTCAELERRNEDLSAFAHTVAHDLQNPLCIIVGASRVLRQERATLSEEEMDHCLDHIVQSGEKMGGIIEALLLLAEVRRDKVPAESLDMADVVREAQKRLGNQIEERRAEIVLPDAWPVALGYAPWVEEVWANYIGNALKYGGTPPHVELGAAALPDGSVSFWVRDNGPGIPVMDQAQLFAGFTRADRVEGHGLGLSIVKSIVEKLGGEVGVESRVGKGSTFSFSLPGDGGRQVAPRSSGVGTAVGASLSSIAEEAS